MATFTAIKNRGGGRGALGGVLRYTQQDEKTLWEGQRSGDRLELHRPVCPLRDAAHQGAVSENGRAAVLPLRPVLRETDDLTPQEAHAIGLELAQREFPDFEVLVATHIDTDHLHSHLIVNSVSFQNGKKLHQSAADLQAHRLASDEICLAHGLDILPPPQKQVKQKRMGSREYRSAAKGESWKLRLMDTIDQCMRFAASKEEFISLMESEGYQVRWTDSRKNITYTTSNGMKCRDDRLHETKYTKEVMEYEFRIRAEIISGGIETAESISERTDDDHTISCPHETGLGGSADRRQRPVPPGEHQQRPAGAPGGQRVGAQEAQLRALTRQVGQLPTQAQLEALARNVAQIRETLKQAGRRREISISPPSLETAFSVLIWLILILLGTMVGMVALQTIWSGLAALWSAIRILLP